MTICASVKVRDGLVLATDSMSQIQEPSLGFIKAYQNARKLFQVGAMPVGAMAYGAGNIGNRSIESFVLEFSQSVNANSVEDVAKDLYAVISIAYKQEFGSLDVDKQPLLGFFLAGYSSGKVFAEEWEFLLPRDNTPIRVRQDEVFGASWRGIDLPFIRLYMGYDPRIIQPLVNAGLKEADVLQILQQYQSPVVYDGMPVQDAINFAAFIVRTTIGVSTFEVGTPACGGPMQLAVILPDGQFRWIQKPDLVIE